MRGVSLCEVTGLERIGVHFIRIAPGKEANISYCPIIQPNPNSGQVDRLRGNQMVETEHPAEASRA